MTATLFSPIKLGRLELPNRIAVSPMCQYSAADGVPTDWHLAHLMTLAMSGAGLVVLEATGVERHGRISHGCLGLYSDECEAGIARVLYSARRVAPPGTAFGIQIGHAGRKASAQRPWEGGKALSAGEDPWQTVSASAIPFGDGWHTPAALDRAGMERVRDAFVQAARRAVRLGFEVIELHAAHGYLLHQFFSPVANRRTDECGGSLANRMRFPLEVARAVRDVMPATVALGARITGNDWYDGGTTPDEAVAFARALEQAGCNYACVSGGGIRPDVKIALGPGYQVPFAERVKRETGMVTRAVGLIADPVQADEIVRGGRADMIAMARAFLDNPRWVWHAADRLGATVAYPPQYARSTGKVWPGAKLARPTALAA
jgi:2,4-dienoyl-CoA reductase-like NADH-dependent reductase (Old Yellow Enzyme family)